MSGRSIFENPPRYDTGSCDEELTAIESWRRVHARAVADSWARSLAPLGVGAYPSRLLGSLAALAAGRSARPHR